MWAGRIIDQLSCILTGATPESPAPAQNLAKKPIMTASAPANEAAGRRTGEIMLARRSGLFAGLVLASALCLNAGSAAGAESPQSAAQRNRVVIQVSDAEPSKWNLALNNARNIQTDIGASNVDIEIVAYGPGLGMLKADSVVGHRIDEAGKAGVKILACENTMRAQKLTQADMLPGIEYVPAGVVELMQRQQQGWAYIRP
jgi:intracellular sulfur oxidation DsrE/DsrF family protein